MPIHERVFRRIFTKIFNNNPPNVVGNRSHINTRMDNRKQINRTKATQYNFIIPIKAPSIGVKSYEEEEKEETY